MVNAMLKKIAALSIFMLLALTPFAAQAQFTDQDTWGGTSGGSANSQTITINNWPTTPRPGVKITFVPAVTNTSATQLTISSSAGSSGAHNLYKTSPAGPVALVGGELQPNQPVEVTYNVALSAYVIISSIDEIGRASC